MYGETVGTILVSSTSNSGYLISSTNVTTGQTITPPTRIFHITLVSGTGTNSVLQIYNGNAATLPQLMVSGTSGPTREVESDYGVFGQSFPLGAYWKTDANLIQAAIVCKSDLTG